MNDSDVILQTQQPGRGIEAICRTEWRPIYDLIYRTVQNRAEAQDLTQEVFLRAVRAIDRYDDRGDSMHALLVTVALNLLRDRWRGRRPVSGTLIICRFLRRERPSNLQ